MCHYENMNTQFIKNYEENFLSKIEKTDSCWIWKASKDRAGYGYYKGTKAHRFSYMMYKGEIPEKMHVCHSCDIPSCVNPDHLWVGTSKQNAQDYSKKLKEGNFTKKIKPQRFLRIRLDYEIYIKLYKLCIDKNLSITKQVIQIIENFILIQEENEKMMIHLQKVN